MRRLQTVAVLALALFVWRRFEQTHATRRAASLFLAGERVFKNDAGVEVPFEEFRVDAPSKSLSVIVPAYNEEARIGVMLDEALGYLSAREKRDRSFSYELIVVSDGSRDQTAAVVRRYVEQYGSDRVRLLNLHQNVGKGGAVRRGMLCGRGKLLLMADADGASKFADLEALERSFGAMQRNGDELCGFAVGSRAHLQDDAVAKRSLLRNILMWGLHLLVMLLGNIWTIKDTQCFPDDDHQILTNRGFLSLAQVVAHVERRADGSVRDWRGLQVANYDSAHDTLVYDTPQRLVVVPRSEKKKPLVQFGSLVTATSDHAMYVDGAKVAAGSLLGSANVAFLARAKNGFAASSSTSARALPTFLAAHQIEPFLALYGAALLLGEPLRATAFVCGQLAAARLESPAHWSIAEKRLRLTHSGWRNAINAAQQHQQQLPHWAFDSLSVVQLRALLSGMAAGSRVIRVTSTTLRDDVMRAMVHAGYVASFSHKNKAWRIAFRDEECVVVSSQAATVESNNNSNGNNGNKNAKHTWCFTMPARGDDASGFVVVRRVARDAKTKAVVRAWPATIQGNCGFKMFGRRTAQQLFSNLHVERWAFDLELLFLAINYFGTPVQEVAINWQEIDGSKLSVVDASLQILRDLARIRFNYVFGVWRADTAAANDTKKSK